MKVRLLVFSSLLLTACGMPPGVRPVVGPPAPLAETAEERPAVEDGRTNGEMEALPAPATGSPTIGPQVRVDRGGSQFTAETSIVATDQNPNEVIAAWTDSRPADGQFSTRLGVGISRDGGRTWEEFLLEPPAPLKDRVQGDPITARDPRTGTVWVGGLTLFARERDGFFVARKRPGAAGFEPPVVVHNEQGADKPWMAAGPDPLAPEKTRLYMSHNLGLQVSEDLGSTWTAPVDLGPYVAFLPRVGPGGELYIAYWDLTNGVMVRRSLDGGRTLETPVRAAQRRDFWDFQDGSRFPGRFRVPPFTYLAVDPRNGTVYCVYFDTTSRIEDESDVDLYMTRSTDRGATWSPPRRIPADAMPGDQFFPWLEVDGSGRLHLVFYDTRFTPQSDADTVGWIDAVYAWSEDGGANWTQHRLTPASFSSAQGSWDGSEFLGDYNGLTVAGNRVYPLYVSTQAGDSDVYTHTILFGDTAGGPCVPTAETLCLNGGRFRVRAGWETATGQGNGRGVALTADSGYFWFFDAANVEVVVKVLDACAPPFNRFWVFATGLTNVGVKLTVEDTQTGAVREYLNPRNRPFQPTFDTDAFATCPAP